MEEFSREKLKSGILKACEKRPISPNRVAKIVNLIERRLRKKHSTKVKSSEIGELTLQILKDVDKVAYMRFASVYYDFDITSFEKEAKALAGETK